MRERSVVRLSATPSTKCSCSGSPPILANGKTTIERRGGLDFSDAGVGAGFRGADLKRIDPDRFGDVLELGRTEIGDREIEPPLDLPVGLLGQTDRAGRANAFEPRGNIDPVAHEIAVALLDNVAEMDADPKFDALVRRDPSVALNEAGHHFNRAAHGVDHAAKLDQDAVPRALDDAPVMQVDSWIDQIATQPPQPRQGAILIRPREPAVADDIGDQDRRDFTHSGAPSGRYSE